MSYEISWLVEGKVGFGLVEGTLSIEEIAELDTVLVEYVNSVQNSNQLVHFIFDGRRLNKMPTNIAEINQVSKVRSQANLGWLLIVNENKIIGFIGHLITQLSRTRYRSFVSLEQAIEFLKTQDTAIDWSLMSINEA